MGRSAATVVSQADVACRSERLPIGPVAWLIVVGVLPLFEFAFLSIRHDSSVLIARGGWLGGLVAATTDLVRAAVPLLAALALIAATRVSQLVPALRPALTVSSRGPLWALAGHLACTGALVWLSEIVFRTPEPSSATLVAWMTAGILAGTLWVAALLPGITRRGPGPVLAGTMAAAVALGLLAAGAATVTREWWQPLGHATLWLVSGVLAVLGFDVGAEPERFLVGTPRFVAEITSYCSGFQGIGLMSVFLTAYLFLFRDRLRFPRALWLLPIGAVLAWTLNAVRIAVLIMVGDAGYAEVAVQGFHYNAGTLFFCVVALGLGAWSASSRTFATVGRAGSWTADKPTAAYVIPLVALLATSLLTGLVARDGFDALYGLRVLVAGAVLWCFRHHLASAGWRVSWRAVLFGIVAFGVWLVLAGRPDAGDDLAAARAALGPAAGVAWIALRLVGAIVVVPLVEEIAFRGYLARRLTATGFETVTFDRVTWPALLAAAAVFGFMHHDVAAGAAVGVLYGVAARRSGQLGDAVVAHAVTNALLALMVLATGAVALWE